MEFFRSIEHLDPIILTACPKSNWAHVATQKAEWVRSHLSAHVTVLPVLGGSSKPLFMHTKVDILIDDFRRNTEAWAAAGGLAILHRSFESTSAELDQAIGAVLGKPAQRGEAIAWTPCTTAPEVTKGSDKYSQLAVKRANGKACSFPAVYCNDYVVMTEFLKDAQGTGWSQRILTEEDDDDGDIALTGWYDIRSNSEYDNATSPPAWRTTN